MFRGRSGGQGERKGGDGGMKGCGRQSRGGRAGDVRIKGGR